MLGLDQAARDGLSQGRHGDHPLARLGQPQVDLGRLQRRRLDQRHAGQRRVRLTRPRFHRAFDVLLGDAAAPTGPLHLVGGQPAFGQRPAGSRSGPQRRLGGRLGLALTVGPLPVAGLRGGRGCGRRGRRRLCLRGGRLIDLGDHLADGHGLARLAENFLQDTAARRGHLDGGLLALDFDQRLVGGDRVALGVLPGTQRGLPHGLAQGRHPQLDRHQLAPFPNASATRRVCSRVCRLADPVAGLADSGRVMPDQGWEPASSPGSSRFT